MTTDTEITRVFIHGLESSGSGTKGSFFRERYPGMIIEDYDGSFHQRMDKLERILEGRDDLILVGSSFGGLMAAVFACLHPERVHRLILLAPALHLEFFKPYQDTRLEISVTIYHGLQDDIVPIDDVKILAEKLYRNLDFHPVEDDHSLHRTFLSLGWNKLLNVKY